MPLPTPNDGESRDAFLSRCMGDDTMQGEYPDDDQRYAVCVGQWNEGQDEDGPKAEKYLNTTVKVDDADDDDHTLVFRVTTDTKDHMDEVVLPGGGDFRVWRKNPVVMFSHNYAMPPVAKGMWIKRGKTDVLSKCRMAEKYANPMVNNPDFALQLYEMFKSGDMSGVSIGFDVKPGGMRKPTEDELKLRPDWKGTWSIIDKWLLLEYSLCSIPCNPDALIARAKSLGMNDASLGVLRKSMPEPESNLPEIPDGSVDFVKAQIIRMTPPEAMAKAICEKFGCDAELAKTIMNEAFKDYEGDMSEALSVLRGEAERLGLLKDAEKTTPAVVSLGRPMVAEGVYEELGVPETPAPTITAEPLLTVDDVKVGPEPVHVEEVDTTDSVLLRLRAKQRGIVLWQNG